jgi:hypothetical protein
MSFHENCYLRCGSFDLAGWRMFRPGREAAPDAAVGRSTVVSVKVCAKLLVTETFRFSERRLQFHHREFVDSFSGRDRPRVGCRADRE